MATAGAGPCGFATRRLRWRRNGVDTIVNDAEERYRVGLDMR